MSEQVFSKENPNLRLIWDSTSLNAFMKDPLSYYWKYVLGYREHRRSIALEWGTAWDKAAGDYHYNRARIENRDEALCKTIDAAINRSWIVGLDELAADSKNDGRKRNIATLIRSLVWYDDWIGDYELYRPLINQPTTHVHDLGLKSPYGEDYVLVTNYDQIVRDNMSGQKLAVERKSTTQTISNFFWYTYDPSVQLNTYDYVLNKEFGTAGVWIEAVQTAIGFTRFDHHEVMRTRQQRLNWVDTVRYWIKQAGELAVNDNWGSASNVATQKYDNITREMLRKSPASWSGILETEFERGAPWNPLDID